MRLLADMNTPEDVASELRWQGHDVVHARDIGLHRAPDDALLDLAKREGRVILTFDLDFGTLLAAGGSALPSVIILRLRDQTPAPVMRRLPVVLAECQAALASGAIVIVDEGRYRLRTLPIGDR